jgi:hypothetical protein
MAKHSTPRRRSGKHWVGTLLTAGAVVACMGLLLRFLPVGTIPTGGDEPSDSAVSSTCGVLGPGARTGTGGGNAPLFSYGR